MNSYESLQARHSIIEQDSEPVFDHIDEFIMHGEGERPWQVFELTQNQNVFEWIKNPDAIELIQPILADLVRRLGPASGAFRMLDAGCYGGYVFDYIKTHAGALQPSFSYTGVDIQAQAILDAREAHADDHRSAFQVGDLFQLSRQFPSASFNVSVCYRVLHHLPRFSDCLRELASVTAGYIHTALPIRDRSQCVRMREKNLETGTVAYSFYRWFSRNEIMETASALNLCAEIHSYPKAVYSTVVFTPKD